MSAEPFILASITDTKGLKLMDPLDQFGAAYAVFLQEAGARLHAFMEVEPPERRPSPVPPDVLEDATRTIIVLTHEESELEPDPSNPEHVAAIQRESLAQAFEEAWEKVISPALTSPTKRAEMLMWLEEQTGRPLPVEGINVP